MNSADFMKAKILSQYGADTTDLQGCNPREKKEEIADRLQRLYKMLQETRSARNQGSVGGNSSKNDDSKEKTRLIMVSRRLPVVVEKADDKDYENYEVKTQHIDELNHMMKCALLLHQNEDLDCTWLGILGHNKDFPIGSHKPLKRQLDARKMVPVFLDKAQEHMFYDGMCKSVLFPLFHNFPPTTEALLALGDSVPAEEHVEGLLWQAYVAVNQRMADAVQAVYREGDLVLIHDYHFMLLPSLLRAVLPGALRIGLFFHIQFPTSELYRLLPEREALLTGCLAADLVGFQTYDYVRHFLSTAESLVLAECSHNGVRLQGHTAAAAVCPIGVDTAHMAALARRPDVAAFLERLDVAYAGRHVYLAVDELDPIHGVVAKLLGLAELLRRRPDLAATAAFVLVLVGHGERGAELRAQVMALVAQLNSRFCRLGAEGPLQLRVNPCITEIFALYARADTYVNTVLRDGMSANPMEYIAVRGAYGRPGTLVLSEFAGCARAMAGALLVSPWDTNHLAEQLLRAAEMEEEDRKGRHAAMATYVGEYTAARWGARMVEQLREAGCAAEGQGRSTARPLPADNLLADVARAQRRLLMFSLEGALCRRVSLPELVAVPPATVRALGELAADPRNMVVVLSPRGGDTMEHALADPDTGAPVPAVLFAENGLFVKWGPESSWQCTLPAEAGGGAGGGAGAGGDAWKPEVLSVLEYFCERAPGSVVEVKALGLAWHYRDCDVMHSSWMARQLVQQLQDLCKRLPISVLPGPATRRIEVQYRPSEEAPNPVDLCRRRMASVTSSAHLRRLESATSLRSARQSMPATPQTRDRSLSVASAGSSQGRERGTSEEPPFFPADDPLPAAPTPPPYLPRSYTAGSRSNSLLLEAGAEDAGAGGGGGAGGPDLILLVGSGRDALDEDLFEYLEPETADLDAFLESLRQELDVEESEGEGRNPPLETVHEEHGDEEDEEETEGPAGAGIRRRGSREGSTLSEPNRRGTASPVKAEELRPTSPVQSSEMGTGPANDHLSLGPGKSLASILGTSVPPGGSPSLGAWRKGKTPRQTDITGRKKFEPRMDFPPAGILYQAMKRKYGPNVSNFELPETPAACWALVYTMVPSLRHVVRTESTSSLGSSGSTGDLGSYSVYDSITKSGIHNVQPVPSVLDPSVFSAPLSKKESFPSVQRHTRANSEVFSNASHSINGIDDLHRANSDPNLEQLNSDSTSHTTTINLQTLGASLLNSAEAKGNDGQGRMKQEDEAKQKSPVPIPPLNMASSDGPNAAEAEPSAGGGASPLTPQGGGAKSARGGGGGAGGKPPLPLCTFTVKVGPSVSQARYFLRRVGEVGPLVARLQEAVARGAAEEQPPPPPVPQGHGGMGMHMAPLPGGGNAGISFPSFGSAMETLGQEPLEDDTEFFK